MQKFMDENFLLESETAQKLYFEHANKMPIIDYHCHLNPREIYEDKKFKDITECWLVNGHAGDHYKWRLMRASGVTEDYITGDKDSKEKFIKWASTIERAIGNPVYHWTHLELKTYFGFNEPLTHKNAEQVYDLCNEKLAKMSARQLIKDSNVKVICTTDDPVDSLEWHLKLKEDKSFDCTVLPSFRPDKAINIDLDWFYDWTDKLGEVSGKDVSTFEGFLDALASRVDFFDSVGCRVADHALDTVEFAECTYAEASTVFAKRLAHEPLTQEEISKYKTYMMIFFGRQYAKLGWAQQYHMAAMRNNNVRLFKELGPDTGFDAIEDKPVAKNLALLMNALDSTDELPRTILYSLNPNYDQLLTTIGYCFNNGCKGKIQIGSGWWFNDHIDGMLKQMHGLADCGMIAEFVGMLTDSRSFMSYPRHDYFRRILCNFFGDLVERGHYPNDMEVLGQIVEDICFNNANKYFGFNK